MSKKLLYILFLLLTTTNIYAQNSASIEYIENKGQWEGNFIYRTNTSRGDVFLERNGFTVLLADKENKEKIHLAKHGKIKEEINLKYHAYKMLFQNTNLNTAFTTEKLQQHYYNYFLGKDQSKWQANVHPALAVNYTRLYDDIDMHVYSNNGNIKYDLIVHPKANTKQIELKYDGVDRIRIVKNRIHIATSLGEQIESEPIAFQFIDGTKKYIKCNYVLKSENTIGFELGKEYNPNYTLTIDPTLVFCSFTGSTSDNWGYTATPGLNGEFYAGGVTSGIGYPTTTGAFDLTYNGGGTGGNGFQCDITISKFNSSGTTLLYATYIGGSNNEQPHSLIVDNIGNLCILGRTYSTNFPTSTNCYDNSHNGLADMVVCKLSPNGNSLLGSTYIGGSSNDIVNFDPGYVTTNSLKRVYGDDSKSEIIVDAANNVYIAANTQSSDFPTIGNPVGAVGATTLQGTQDGVVLQLNANLTNLLWSRYLGGSNVDAAYNLTIDQNATNFLYVTGGTSSGNFPTTAGSYHPTYQGGITDGFLTKFNLANKALIRSTYIGTNQYDQVFGVHDDNSNNIYIMGSTLGAYPVTAGVYNNPGSNQFIACLDSSLANNIRSTVFGSGAAISTINLSLNAFLVDICGNVYVSGWGGDEGGVNMDPLSCAGLPITPGAIKSTSDSGDFYFIVLNQNLAGLLYATYYGQQGGGGPNAFGQPTLGPEHVDGGTSRFDASGTIYQAICANCGTAPKPVFPTSGGSYSPNNPSPNCNLAALKIAFDLIGPSADANAAPSATGCAPFTITFQNTSTNATSYIWNFGDGSPTTSATNPTHTFVNAGTYTVTLTAVNPAGCFGTTDIDTLVIVVINDLIVPSVTGTEIDTCGPYTASFTNNTTIDGGALNAWTTVSWDYGDGSSIFNGINSPIHNYASPGTYNVTVTITDTATCNSPQVVTFPIVFNPQFVQTSVSLIDTGCAPLTVNFTSSTSNATTYLWNFGNGNTSTAPNPTFTYNIPGTYTVTLIVNNPTSCNLADTAQDIITVKPALTPGFSLVKQDSCGPYTAVVTNNSTFNGTASENASTVYNWDFGDGTTSTVFNPGLHLFPGTGTYTVTLSITNPFACISPVTFTQVITFDNLNISTAFDMPDTACVPFTWVFNNNTINPSIYNWNFGDGNTSNSSVPSHTYTAPGTYTVTLLVNNPLTCNLVDSAEQIVTVFGNPTADFIYAPNPPLANTAVNFTNLSTGAISYIWNFGDGESSVEKDPSHLFNKTYNFNVCLTAINEYGCPDSVCKRVDAKVINGFDIPTGITPNDDNINDWVFVRGFGIESMILRIYNRWGELVFETKDIKKGWDGKYKGVVQEVDAYAYVLDVKFTDGTTQLKKGNITLIK